MADVRVWLLKCIELCPAIVAMLPELRLMEQGEPDKPFSICLHHARHPRKVVSRFGRVSESAFKAFLDRNGELTEDVFWTDDHFSQDDAIRFAEAAQITPFVNIVPYVHPVGPHGKLYYGFKSIDNYIATKRVVKAAISAARPRFQPMADTTPETPCSGHSPRTERPTTTTSTATTPPLRSA